MKLSETVAKLNLLDSLDVPTECDVATGALKHISYVVADRANTNQTISADIAKTYSELEHLIKKFANQFEDLRQELRSEIVQRESEYLAESLEIYREGMIHDTPDVILNRRMRIDDADDIVLRTRLKNLTDWRLPGMIIRPGVENYIEDMVPMDPLYVIDHDRALTQLSIEKFTPEYQRRLREYIVNDWEDEPILDKLPDNQFGLIFAYYYFNHKPMPIINQFLLEFYKKLRPGGSVIFTYNNCDLASGVDKAERAWMLYTPRRLIERRANELGFELTAAYDGEGDVSWLELRKPGDITSLRGGQTLAKVLAKDN